MDQPTESNEVTAESSHAIRLAAEAYALRGWSVIPVPHREKNPGFTGWQKLRLTHDTVPAHFNGHPQNVGVLLGEPSGWLIDVDLDHPRAVELAAQFLPVTSAIFGRPGKPRSHWLYRVTGTVASKKHKSKSSGMIVEIRSTGLQTIFPPSTHESGEPIKWAGTEEEPATVDPQELHSCVRRLAETVLVELGERSARSEHKRSREKRAQSESASTDAAGNAARCLNAMLRIALVDHRDGSHRLFVCACRAVEHDLDDSTALVVIRAYARNKPFPKSWTDDEVIERLRDAEKHARRGCALEVETNGCITLGGREPSTGKLVLSPTRTLPTAESFVREFHMHPAGRTLHCNAGMLSEWRDNRYCELEDNAVKKQLQAWLHEALRYVADRRSGEMQLVDFQSNPGTVKAALESIKAFVHLAATTPVPSWLGGEASQPPPSEIVACRSTLLHLPTMRRLPPTPLFFTTCALDFDPDPSAVEPMAWHRFLHQLFDGDLEALELLQEWFGYCLTGDTSQQKMLLIVGPRRSGKGTIARVLAKLIGAGNVCGPTTSSLAGPFGLQPLIGKSLAIVSDARFHGENIATVVERLLCISGEDTLTVDRKNIGSITLKLPTRFTFLTNEFPRFNDSSGALAGRFIILRLTESFYGKEDPELTDRLFSELPGILNWAIAGWRRLHERGHFVMPPSSLEVVQEIEDLSSPVAAFVRERCEIGPDHRVVIDSLYEAWSHWCEGEGRQAVKTKQLFCRDLVAAFPSISRRRGTGQQGFYEGIELKGDSAL
jgi:putative DNA primase/helicase